MASNFSAAESAALTRELRRQDAIEAHTTALKHAQGRFMLEGATALALYGEHMDETRYASDIATAGAKFQVAVDEANRQLLIAIRRPLRGS